MISGPFTDEIVRMLRGSANTPPADGDVLYNGKEQYGVKDHDVVYVSEKTVCKVPYADFAANGVRVLRFPMPLGDGFRFTDAADSVWVPEFTEAEKTFLREVLYQVYDAATTVANIKAVLGEKHHPFYAISAKTGVLAEEDVRQLAVCLQKAM